MKEQPAETLARIQSGASNNDAFIVMMLSSKYPDVQPRVNVLTFKAWKALGRHVRKGEHGLSLTIWIPVTHRNAETGEVTPDGTRPKSVTVFHISQTDTEN